jgi:DNA replication protein DnaC
VPPLAADLADELKRLKMAAMRRIAPELLPTAKTQRWQPEEFLRTLVEAGIASRDESNARTRMRSAAFPVVKTLEELDLGASCALFGSPLHKQSALKNYITGIYGLTAQRHIT